ncbi:DNA repair protein RecO [Raineyella sp. W15-4]|uniref:DNA repair protein RecO n=1 Tax=Raineyella sp. W15-4 TaxID=3081651 RepID=UPI0029545160|nr:DNA repair protein RecO [Raineyella sp. W15-4]WOQ15670.1 DNA repair protein RecO [Raineyella sp. W15-4]
MPTYRDQAVVLRTHKLGEADRIITLLTRAHGKVRAVARGVRRTGSKFGARLEPFSHVDLQLATGRSLHYVDQVETVQAYGARLASDYPAWTAGEVMVETADKLVGEEHQPALQQYRLLVGALAVLVRGTSDGPRPAAMVLDSYLLRSMAVAGYAPTFTDCASCGAPGPHTAFSPAAGGVVCRFCRPPASAHPQPATLDLLSALLVGDWPATSAVEAIVQREASGLTAAFVNWHMERGLRSLSLVER